MATRSTNLHDVPPMVPSRTRSSGHYNRSASASDVMAQASSQNNNNHGQPNKPPSVPRNSLIRSSSAQLYRQQQQQQHQVTKGIFPLISLVYVLKLDIINW